VASPKIIIEIIKIENIFNHVVFKIHYLPSDP
jgi:hypothetical protein